MKKSFCAALASLLFLTAVSCNQTDTDAQTQSSESTADTMQTEAVSVEAVTTDTVTAAEPIGTCVHTDAFHTISDALIDFVGEDAYHSFSDQFAGTEEYNVFNFLSYFYMDIEDIQNALQKEGTAPSPYTADDLFGNVQTQKALFLLSEYRNTDVQFYYGLPTLAECQEIVGWYNTELQFALSAFLRNDWEQFAKLCDIEPEVYAHMQGMEISDYTLTKEMISDLYYPDNINPYPVLTFTVTESQSELFPKGEHTLIWDHSLHLYFATRETFHAPVGDMSAAERYVFDVHSDIGFSRIMAEGMSQWGLCDFIIGRLDVLHGNHEPRTAEEIGDYAEKYLGVDRNTLSFEYTVDRTEDGRYVRIGRGLTSYYHTFLSEEIRDGITVVTVQFWADPSQTVPSRKVEYHMELIDGEYKPLHTVILEDSPFKTARAST